MKTYIINLPTSRERHDYMAQLLAPFDFLDIAFIEAVDGRKIHDEERRKSFDYDAFKRRMMVNVRPAEFGCTMSHRKCYDALLKSDDMSCLIFEDDIDTPKEFFNADSLSQIEEFINVAEPRIVLISDWFRFTSTAKKYEDFKLVKVFDGYLSHAYIINRQAAEVMLSKLPHYAADDWLYIRRLGISIYACIPHFIQQKWDGSMPTSIQSEKSDEQSCPKPLSYHFRILCLRALHALFRLTGHFYLPVNDRVD